MKHLPLALLLFASAAWGEEREVNCRITQDSFGHPTRLCDVVEVKPLMASDMTMRDVFAAAALASDGCNHIYKSKEGAAECAYGVADFMLKKRERRK